MILNKRGKDLTGNRFGSLTAICPTKVINNMYYWLFQCVCGKLHEARGNTVVHHSKKGNDVLPSCGCKELEQKTKHGFRKAKGTHPAYRAYRGMMNRCYNTNVKGYEWYGAVGVTVCEEWKNNPAAFVEWAINNGWQPGLHIDKDILCDAKNIHPHIYSPETCQWTSAKINVGHATNRNNYGKHPNVKLSHAMVKEMVDKYATGEFTYGDLAQQYGVNYTSARNAVRQAQGKG